MKQDRKILIADDHGIIRDGLRALLAAEPDFKVVGAVASDSELPQAVAQLAPDLVIVDIAMAGNRGGATIAAIRQLRPDTAVLVLTFQSDDFHIQAALGAGARGYVLKDDSKTDLLTAIHAVLTGKHYLSPAICDVIIRGYLENSSAARSAPPRAGTLDILTSREREVLKLIAEGFRTREIATMLCLSHKTVEKHRGSMMRKLSLRSAAAAAAYAIANGLVRP